MLDHGTGSLSGCDVARSPVMKSYKEVEASAGFPVGLGLLGIVLLTTMAKT